jgi:hypothetical protein
MPGVSDRVSGFTLGLSALGVSLILYCGATREKEVWRGSEWSRVVFEVSDGGCRNVREASGASDAGEESGYCWDGVLARRGVATAVGETGDVHNTASKA